MTDSTHPSLFPALQDTAQRDQAWPVFQQRYEEMILRWCQNRGLREADARDLCQEILLKLWRDLKEGKYDRERGKFRTYLSFVVRSAVNNYLDKEAKRPGAVGSGETAILEQLQHVSEADLSDISESIDNSIQADIQIAYERALNRIKPENQVVVRRILIDEEKPVDVAKDLGRGPTEIFQLMARTRKFVKEEYEKLLHEHQA